MDLPCSATIIMSLSEVLLSSESVVVFDLDDTLYAERDFVRSGFRAISRRFESSDQARVFRLLESFFDSGDADPLGSTLREMRSRKEKAALLQVYREHEPCLELAVAVRELLEGLTQAGHRLGILTDGRSVTQRNKIEALGLGAWVHEIVISEEFGSGKPDPRNYQHFERAFSSASYVYVGDNLTKDFVSPNQLGWVTVGVLDCGKNIHPQCLDQVKPGYGPQFFMQELAL